MARFAYSALSSTGDTVSGQLDAADEAAVIDYLHDQGLLPISAAPQQDRVGEWLLASLQLGRSLPGRELAIYAQQLGRLLKAHLPLDRSLEIVAGLSGHRRLQRVARALLDRVRDGSGLADAMEGEEGAFPAALVGLVRAGELGGALPAVLARSADFLSRVEAMRHSVISALIYPCVLVVVASVSVGLILTLVLPEFEPLFQSAGDRLPESTRLVIAIGDGLRNSWWAVLIIMVAIAAALRGLMRVPSVALARDRVFISLPFVGMLITKFEAGRFSRTFGTLRANGVPAPMALALAGRTISNRLLTSEVEEVAIRFKEGESLSASLARSRRFPDLATQLVKIGEETGRLEEMLAEIAETYEQEVQRVLERLLALLVPALTIAMGVVIAFIISAVMSAMISINDLAL